MDEFSTDHLLVAATERMGSVRIDSRFYAGMGNFRPGIEVLTPPWFFRTHAETHGYCMDLWRAVNGRRP